MCMGRGCHIRHQFDSKTDMPKDMVGVAVLKLLRQWLIGVLAPPPVVPISRYALSAKAFNNLFLWRPFMMEQFEPYSSSPHLPNNLPLYTQINYYSSQLHSTQLTSTIFPGHCPCIRFQIFLVECGSQTELMID